MEGLRDLLGIFSVDEYDEMAIDKNEDVEDDPDADSSDEESPEEKERRDRERIELENEIFFVLLILLEEFANGL